MRKNKFIKRIVMFIVSILVISSPILRNISHAEGSKTIVINSHSYNEYNEKIAIPRAEFYLYKVGEYDGNNYILTDEFKNSWVDINNNSAKVELDSANRLYKYAHDNNINGRLEISDSNGRAVFSGLDDGVYVIAQDGSVKIEDRFYSSSPFLVKSPAHFEDNSMITVEPKYGIEENTPNKTDNPPNDTEENSSDKSEENDPIKGENTRKKVKTGDEGILSTVLLFILAFVRFILLNIKRKNK